ncbi:MAG: SDR family oxidoreductase [Burkholderiaceae bacterium]|nr:SDR family oxidoreductase [Burkholderiaceae bacterium]
MNAVAIPSPVASAGRLAGKVALVTGAAGNLGSEIVRAYLREGATVVFTGRDQTRLDAAIAAAVADTGVPAERASGVVMDAADPDQVRAGIAAAVARHGRIDVLVNNAGSAGPRQPLAKVPLTRDELDALRAEGFGDTETLGDAVRNILCVAWNVVRAAAPSLAPGASVINISTVFSRTDYYGRAAYVVPKAALNAVSRELSLELGARGVRVNTVFPGPIRSERIRNVFAAMDKLKGQEPGTTAQGFFDRMTLARALDGEAPTKTFPVPADVAAACVFLGSDDSGALNGQELDISHGMQVAKESRSHLMSRPTLRTVDASGLTVLVAAGDQLDEAITIARMQAEAGAHVVLGLARADDVAHATRSLGSHRHDRQIDVRRFDRTEPESMTAVLDEFAAEGQPIAGVVALPAYGAGRFTGSMVDAGDDDVDAFIDDEVGGALALARTVSRHWRERDDLPQDPRLVFVTNGDDGAGNTWANGLRAAVEELVRIWRGESEVDVRNGRAARLEWSNQIVRYGNREAENVPFTAGHAARLLFKERRVEQIDLHVPESIVDATGARRSTLGFTENLTGLHTGKAVLITGGSAGIGGQVARLLAIGGARVMMVARRASELDHARDRIVGELEDIGYSGAGRRVRTLAGIDVGNLASLEHAVQETVKAFGRIDYLINNAGVAGAEEMVVDMNVDAWRYTLDANLVSNYALMHAVVPTMRQQGGGYILNVSSYFGGEKHLAVAYPNRADYAVSKAGQRALVEATARFLGPEIQINALAPGPVEGDRLKGTGGRPGLFERRGRLILENKRLNAVHMAVVKSLRRGTRIETVLARLAANDVSALAIDSEAPHELRQLAVACSREGDDECTWGQFLLSEKVAERLVTRLRTGGHLLDSDEWRDRAAGGWLAKLPPDDKPWLPPQQIAREAAKVRNGVLSLLHLRKMPTEGGLSVERSITEREMFGSPKRERLDQMRGRTVWLLGEHLVDYLAEAARQLVHQCQVGKVVLITATEAGASALQRALRDVRADALEMIPLDQKGMSVESAMDDALVRFGHPTTVVSTPFAPLPEVLFGRDDEVMLPPAGFRDLVEAHLTQHFRVSRKASLIDGAQIVLVTPDVPYGRDAKGVGFALANFVKTTLHAFTATLAVENERLAHDVPVNQINLTRRVRSEEPRNEEEHDEEVKRFARAVLLAGAPLPDAEDSRYRARIYRGMSLTV